MGLCPLGAPSPPRRVDPLVLLVITLARPTTGLLDNRTGTPRVRVSPASAYRLLLLLLDLGGLLGRGSALDLALSAGRRCRRPAALGYQDGEVAHRDRSHAVARLGQVQHDSAAAHRRVVVRHSVGERRELDCGKLARGNRRAG